MYQSPTVVSKEEGCARFLHHLFCFILRLRFLLLLSFVSRARQRDSIPAGSRVCFSFFFTLFCTSSTFFRPSAAFYNELDFCCFVIFVLTVLLFFWSSLILLIFVAGLYFVGVLLFSGINSMPLDSKEEERGQRQKHIQIAFFPSILLTQVGGLYRFRIICL